MNFYKFPIIQTIDDVLPHIDGRPEFIVAEREFFNVINYMVSMPDTFDMSGPDDLGGAIRRECRGLLFDKMGHIISRPFSKFFNISEKPETQVSVLDFSLPHTIYEKLDGSMIRVSRIYNNIPMLATKMGETDVSAQAQCWLTSQSYEKTSWLNKMYLAGKTPLFEWISPENRIVIRYDSADLVLLAIRDNITGEYHNILDFDTPFNIVPSYGSLGIPISQYIEKARVQQGREGDIIRWNSGHMVKLKNDTYVSIHKTKDQIRSNRHIVDLMLKNMLDDIYPHLDEGDTKRVRDFELDFWIAIERKQHYIEETVNTIISDTNGDRKRIALEVVPTIADKTMPAYVFGALTGKRVRDMIMTQLEKNMFADVRFNEFWQWLNEVN